jgi:hypothetical protein
MTKASDNIFPKVLFLEGSAPSSPSSGDQALYVDSADHRVKRKNSGGTVYGVDGGAELDYVEFTSNVNITATTEATANTIVTSSTITYDGVLVVRIEFYCPAIFLPAGAGITCDLWLYEKVGAGAAASIGKIAEYINTAAGQSWETAVMVARRRTPSAAAIIYSIRGSTSSGTSIAAAGAGGSGNAMPGYIRVTAA